MTKARIASVQRPVGETGESSSCSPTNGGVTAGSGVGVGGASGVTVGVGDIFTSGEGVRVRAVSSEVVVSTGAAVASDAVVLSRVLVTSEDVVTSEAVVISEEAVAPEVVVGPGVVVASGIVGEVCVVVVAVTCCVEVSPESGVLFGETVSVANEIGSWAFVCSRFSFDGSAVCSVDFAVALEASESDVF